MNVRRIREEIEKLEKKLADGRFRSYDLLRYMQLKKTRRSLGITRFPLSDKEWNELDSKEASK